MKIVDDVVVSETPDGAIVFDPRRGKYFQLNKSALRVLSLLRSGRPIDVVVSELSQSTSMDEDSVAQDVHNLIRYMKDAHIVEEGE